MQRVISRVHQIVTTHGGGDSDGSGSGGNDGSGDGDREARPLLGAHEDSALGASPSSSSSSSPAAVQAASPANHSREREATPQAVKEIRLAVDRLQYATLLGERKKAVASLHELASQFASTQRQQRDSGSGGGGDAQSAADHAALGLAAIPVLLNALISDPRDTELMEAMLELLQTLVVASPRTATALLQVSPVESASSVLSSSMPLSGMQICLQLLQDPSPWIRGPTITLVKCLQDAQQAAFATSVLECKEGLRRLLEVVEDKREHIRDAALQVLVKLTEREKNVQQFLAFEDGFVRLFQIMEAEGLQDGSSVVSDCLQIVNNMVRDNLMTQTLFRELPVLVTHVPQLLALPSKATMTAMDAEMDASTAVNRTGMGTRPSARKSTQKKRSLKLVLQLIRFLVAGLHEGVDEQMLDELARRERARKATDLPSIQSFMGRQTMIMGAIAEIVCCEDEEWTDVRLQALDLLQLLGDGNGGNQIILVNLMTIPSRRSLLSELIRLDIAEDETPVGASATNLLDALFAKNESAKMAVFQHLNAPPPMMDDEHLNDVGNDSSLQLGAGRVLLDAMIVNAEALTSEQQHNGSLRTRTIVIWKACHRFASLIDDSAYCKVLALRIPSQYQVDETRPVAGDLFLSRCLRLLDSSHGMAHSHSSATAIFHMKVAILTLMIKWCVECPEAVVELTSSVTNLSILVNGIAEPHSKDDKSNGSTDERVQVQGLFAVLFGCCLEYKTRDTNTEGKASSSTSDAPDPNPTQNVSRQQLLDMISKRASLDQFTSALIRFQQVPAVVSCARAGRHQSARMLLAHQALFHGDDDGISDRNDGSPSSYLFPLYDKSFTMLFRELTEKIQKRVIAIYTCTDTSSDEMSSLGGGPSAVGAYQDLIRMQDAQIQILQEELNELKRMGSHAVPVTNGIDRSSSVQDRDTSGIIHDEEKQVIRRRYEDEITQLKASHKAEQDGLELKLEEMTQQTSALDARFIGLTRAFEQLEIEHMGCVERSGASLSVNAIDGSSNGTGSVRMDLEEERAKCRRLENELHAERQARAEVDQRLSHTTYEWEMAQLRTDQMLQELRQKLEERDEQLAENNQILDLLKTGQEIAKRNATQYKNELDRLQSNSSVNPHHTSFSDDAAHAIQSANDEKNAALAQLAAMENEAHQLKVALENVERNAAGSHDKNPSSPSSKDRQSSKSDAAAKELYQLWEKERAKVRELKKERDCWEAERTALNARFKSLDGTVDVLEGQFGKQQEALFSSEMKHSSDRQAADAPGGMVSDQPVNVELQTLREQMAKLTEEKHHLDDLLRQQKDDVQAREEELLRSNETINMQESEIYELRRLVTAMESAATTLESRRNDDSSTLQTQSEVEELKEQISTLKSTLREQKRKHKATVSELEGEISRIFLEKKEQQRKTKASLKQLENEIARMFLEKVELEKKLKEQSTAFVDHESAASNGSLFERSSHDASFESETMSFSSVTGDQEQTGDKNRDKTTNEREVTSDGNPDMDDMLILLASLEIQCSAFRDCLRDANGEQAVKEAVQLSRRRGALAM